LAASPGTYRIALITERFPPDVGGLAASVGRLARGLTDRGEPVDVFYLTAELAPGEIRREAREGVSLHLLGRHRRVEDTLAGWIAHLESEHRSAPFSVLHAYYATSPGFVAVHAGDLLGVPSVVSVRGNDVDRTVLDPAKAAHTLHALRGADAVTANSRDLARKAAGLGGRREVALIPNGVDAERFRPLPRDPDLLSRLGLEDRHVIGFVGEARAKTGLADLLLAYRRLASGAGADRGNGRPETTLLLVGGVRPDDRGLVEVFRAQNPTLHTVVVDPVVPRALVAYYALLNVLVLPSLRDGLPNALLEGMACGRAVVATDVGGMPDVLRDGENGILVPAGDVERLADSIRALLDDRDRRKQLGQEARLTVQEGFTPERELDLTQQVYRRLQRREP
jgi:glycosyltransferase involved in cell wall biosynthesis